MPKKALITGIAGQDGSYLAELLLCKEYEVVGIERQFDQQSPGNLENAFKISESTPNKLRVVMIDLTNTQQIEELIGDLKPNEVYNFAAQSHVGMSFQKPELTAQVTGLGPLRLLEAIRKYSPDTKFLQASSSEIFATPQDDYILLNEKSSKKPRNPYGISKFFAHQMVECYREVHGIFAINAILFNHESPRRGGDFVTKKIAREMVKVSKDSSHQFQLGNLDGGRDWGFAPNYVEGMYQLMQLPNPEDAILATGKIHTVRDLIKISAKILEIPITFEGKGLDEKVLRTDSGKVIVTISEEFYRPIDSNPIKGDSSKLHNLVNWKAENSLEKLLQEMIREEMID